MNYFNLMLAEGRKAFLIAKEHERKIAIHDAKLLESAQRQILNEAKIAQVNNAVMLQDLEIERRKLELEILQRQIRPPEFNPVDPP